MLAVSFFACILCSQSSSGLKKEGIKLFNSESYLNGFFTVWTEDTIKEEIIWKQSK